jgi:hypothetical protein
MSTPNPYEAPAARVADIAEPAPQMPRPRAVTWAAWMLWVTIALVFVDLPTPVDPSTISLIAIGVTYVVIVFTAWLVFLIGKRRNWARITYLILFVPGVVFHVTHLRDLLTHTPIDQAVTFAQALLQLAAMILVFLPASNAWFRRA